MQEIRELEFKLREEYAPHRGWEIRLIENALGGISFGALLYSGYAIISNGYLFDNWQFYIYLTVMMFSLVNMIRFLRDELISIPYLFYKLGIISKQSTIDKLIHENNELKQEIAMHQTSSAVRSTDKTNTVYQAALKMIKLYYTGYEIDRASCQNHGIREVDWNPARELLVRAGIVNTLKTKRTELLDITFTEAKQKLQEIL